MQKIAADKVNIIECDRESTFFQNLTQYIITHWPWNFEKKSVAWKRLYKIIYQGVQENIVILNVTIFSVQTKVFGNIKFCCLIITPFVS